MRPIKIDESFILFLTFPELLKKCSFVFKSNFSHKTQKIKICDIGESTAVAGLKAVL